MMWFDDIIKLRGITGVVSIVKQSNENLSDMTRGKIMLMDVSNF